MEAVNTAVVRALMHLQGIDEASLAKLVHVTRANMSAWLHDLGEDSEERVPFDSQLEALRILGINGAAPRSDVVHYWRVHESLFSRPSTSYWALAIALKAFGKAQAVFVTRESDPALTFQSKAHFALRFAGFNAILEVTAHPLRSISFDPGNMVDISWVPETIGVLLPVEEYEALEPGAMRVRNLQQYLTYSAEVRQWERLRDTALEQGIRASEVATLLSTPGLNALPGAVAAREAEGSGGDSAGTPVAQETSAAPAAAVVDAPAAAASAVPPVVAQQAVADAPAPAPTPAAAATPVAGVRVTATPKPSTKPHEEAAAPADDEMALFLRPVVGKR